VYITAADGSSDIAQHMLRNNFRFWAF